MSQHAVLDNVTHRDLRINVLPSAELGDAVMSSVIVPNEFRQVQHHYPILFRLDPERNNFFAIALFGFETGENLFLDGDAWIARYRPLAMDIQPFLIGRAPGGDGPGQVHIDMAHPRIAKDEGMRVFDETGQPTPYLESIAEKLGALDEGYRASHGFFEVLRQHQLLEPFTLKIELADASKHQLVGFHIINEDRLRSLDTDTLGHLHADGHLMPIFMALASLSAIGDLVDRKNKRLSHG